MAARRWGTLAVLVLAMTAGLVACDPPVGSGLTITATTKTTGLEPGSVVEVRVAGAKANQAVELYQCVFAECVPFGAVNARADRNGAVTVRFPVQGTGGSSPWDTIWQAERQACRAPTTCSIYVTAGRDRVTGEPLGLATTSVPLKLNGRQATFTATPTSDLEGGETITVTGSAPGAAGRKVRIARFEHFLPRNSETWTKVGGSVYVTVRSDGTFTGAYTLPADRDDADCSLGSPDSVCAITAWVVKADGSAIDTSFGKPAFALGFAA